MLLDPPNTFPRGQPRTAPSSAIWGVVVNAQSTADPHSCIASRLFALDMLAGPLLAPASNNATCTPVCSDNRDATTHPADPAPMTT